MARAMQSRCCWPPESPVPDSSRRSLTSSIEPRLLQAADHDLVEVGLGAGEAVDARTVGDVLVDGFGERIGLLEDHADARPELHGVDPRRIDIHAVEIDLAGDAAALDGVVHPVQAAQERRLAATGRTDQGGHRAVANVERDVEQRLLLAVEHAYVARRHLDGRAAASVAGVSAGSTTGACTWIPAAPLPCRLGRHLRLHDANLLLPLPFESVSEHDGHDVHDHQEAEQHQDRRRSSRHEAALGAVRPADRSASARRSRAQAAPMLSTLGIKAFMPIKSSGAVSPSACAMPMMVPVRMPGMARGRTWCSIT